MRRDTVFRHLVHFTGTNLHLNRPMPADHRRMQRLITIRLGQADVVLEAARNRPEGVMHHGQGAVTALQRRAENPHRRHVVDLVEGLLLALHLAPDAIKMLGTAGHFTALQAHRRQPVPQQLHRDSEPILPIAALAGHLLLDLAEGLRFENLEGEIFEFPLEATDAEPIGQRRVDIAGFAGNALLLLGLEGPEGAHVVQPIGQLHQHHPDVTGHGQEHAPQVLGLGLGLVGEVNASQLGDPLHQGAHLGTEMQLDLLGCDLGVLHDIVQEAGSNHGSAGPDVAQQVCDRHRMNDVRLAAGPELALMQLVGEIKSRSQQGLGVDRAALAVAGRDMANAILQPGGQRDAVVGGLVDRPTASRRQALGWTARQAHDSRS